MQRNRSQSSFRPSTSSVESLESRQFLSAVPAPTWIVDADPTAPAGAAEQLGGDQTLNVKIDDVKSASPRNLKIDDVKSASRGKLKIDDIHPQKVREIRAGGAGFDSASVK